MPAHLRTPVTCAVVAVATGDGIRRIFHSLGVQGIVTGGQSMNPSTAELLEAVEQVPADHVVILPNNKNIIPVAEQVDAQTTKTVRVVPTKGIAEGFAALLAYDPEAEGDDNAEEMADAAANVVAGEVTQAVRDSSCDVGPIAGATGSASPATASAPSSPTLGDAATKLLAELVLPSHEIVTSSRARAPRAAMHPPHHRVARRAPPGGRGRGPPRRPAALPVPLRHRVAGASGSATSPSCDVTELKGVGPERAKALAADRRSRSSSTC